GAARAAGRRGPSPSPPPKSWGHVHGGRTSNRGGGLPARGPDAPARPLGGGGAAARRPPSPPQRRLRAWPDGSVSRPCPTLADHRSLAAFYSDLESSPSHTG